MLGDRELLVAYAPMASTGWGLALVAETANLLQVLGDLKTELDNSTLSLVLTRILPVGGVILILALGFGLWLTGRLVTPLQKLAVAARQIGEGRWDEVLSPTGDTGAAAKRQDEVGQLAQSLQTMGEQLKVSFGDLQTRNSELRLAQGELHETNEILEQRVTARTEEMAALFEVTMLTSESQDLADLIGPALARIIDIGSCQASCIHLLSGDQTYLSLVAHQGLAPDEIASLETVAVQPEFSAWLQLTGDPILMPDLNAPSIVPQELRAAKYRSYLGAQLRARGAPQGLLSCFRESDEQFLINEVSLLVALGEQLGVVVENHRLYQGTRTVAILEERERLARDMHDSVTQSLYGLTLFARSGREAAEDGDMGRVERSLAQLEEHSSNALREMRLSLYRLQPLMIENEGLVKALEYRLDSVERGLGIEPELQADSEIELSLGTSEELYRIAIEALNNVLKHAEATTVNVGILSGNGEIRLEVRDNGRGFESNGVQPGMGLKSMRERAEVLKGRLEISSSVGEGTLVRITIDDVIEG